jgi:hypothetical protein
MKKKITKVRLRKIIKDALSKSEKRRRRRNKVFNYDIEDQTGDDYLSALGRGIIKDGCVGNAAHGLDGHFVDPDEEDGSYSLPKGKGCERPTGQHKRKGRKRVGDREPCGRQDRRKMCSEDMEQKNLVYTERLKSLIRRTIKDEISKAARKNNCTMNDILMALDRFEDASRGRLGDKK